MSALSSIAKEGKRIENILHTIQEDQGKYTVMFYKAGEEISLCVDDKLPVINNKLIFS